MSRPVDESETPSALPDAKPTRRERLKAFATRLKDESVELLGGLERIRPHSRTVSAGFLIFERDRDFPTSLPTGALAAKIVIFLIPFFILVIFAISLGADLAAADAAEAAEDVGVAGMFAEAAQDSQAASGQLRLFGLLFTAFAMVWAADGLGRTTQLATSVVWRAPRHKTIDAAAERLGISATAVEKDYWVSEVLRVLASEFAGEFISKGGTSLSKGYDLIQRFSEDIDILVLPGDRGRGATDKLMKQMSAVVAEGIGGTASQVGGAETGRHR